MMKKGVWCCGNDGPRNECPTWRGVEWRSMRGFASWSNMGKLMTNSLGGDCWAGRERTLVCSFAVWYQYQPTRAFPPIWICFLHDSCWIVDGKHWRRYFLYRIFFNRTLESTYSTSFSPSCYSSFMSRLAVSKGMSKSIYEILQKVNKLSLKSQVDSGDRCSQEVHQTSAVVKIAGKPMTELQFGLTRLFTCIFFHLQYFLLPLYSLSSHIRSSWPILYSFDCRDCREVQVQLLRT